MINFSNPHEERPVAERAKLEEVRVERRGRRSWTGRVAQSRLALSSLLIFGLLLTCSGVTVAANGIAGSGSAGTAQYEEAGEDGSVLGGRDQPGGAEAAQAAEQRALGGSGNSLPFTGLLAIPLMLGGVGLAITSIFARRRLSAG